MRTLCSAGESAEEDAMAKITLRTNLRSGVNALDFQRSAVLVCSAIVADTHNSAEERIKASEASAVLAKDYLAACRAIEKRIRRKR
jgi:hypothetical protein